MNYPKVSVFLPVYNQERYIAATLDSIFVQNYPNLEIVVGDDCSTDGTLEVVRSYAQQHPGLFKILTSPVNTGITANCNRILRECTGEYLALFAGDDLWLPGKLHDQVEYFQQNPNTVLCATRGAAFESDSGEILYWTPDPQKLYASENTLTLTRAIGFAGCSFMIASWAIPPKGFNGNLPNTSDWLFWVEVLEKGDFGFINKDYFRYRRHKSNFSCNNSVVLLEHLLTLELLSKNLVESAEKYQSIKEEILIEYIAAQASKPVLAKITWWALEQHTIKNMIFMLFNYTFDKTRGKIRELLSKCGLGG